MKGIGYMVQKTFFIAMQTLFNIYASVKKRNIMKHVLHPYRILFVLTFLLGSSTLLFAQNTIQRDIKPFKKVMVSDGIDLVLTQGPSNKLELAYRNVEEKDIITKVEGNKLKIYLAGCRYGCHTDDHEFARVTAYLTYETLEKLIVRGDNEVTAKSDIHTKKFTLRSMGDGEISLKSVHADRMKAAFYGDSGLEIGGGAVEHLRIKSFGDNTMNLRELPSQFTKICAFGDSDLDVQVHHKMNVTVLGDTNIHYYGDPWVDKKLVLGDMSLSRR